MIKKGISVVIPNYNGRELLVYILPPLLKALKKTVLPFEIIISDDNSIDDSIFFIESEYPDIILIKNSNNRGFSPTINEGIFISNFDYVLLLNNDVILTEDYFIPLLRYFDKEDTFGVMGKIIGWDDDQIQDGAKYPNFHGLKIKTNGNYISKNPCKNDWLYSIYLSGANALIDRKKLMQLRGFDEMFAPFYVEDYELSIRAWRLGWKCYYEHFAVCRHKTSFSIKKKNKKLYIKAIYNRNKMFLHSIHLSRMSLFLYFIQLTAEAILNILILRWNYLNAIRMFLFDIEKIKKARRNILMISKELKRPALSLRAVVKKIRLNIKLKEIDLF